MIYSCAKGVSLGLDYKNLNMPSLNIANWIPLQHWYLPNLGGYNKYEHIPMLFGQF
jgi:hypothetical protein